MPNQTKTLPKLNQILAIEAGTRKRDYADLTKTHQTLQKGTLFEGHIRTFKPRDEDGQQYPDDKKPVQLDAKELVKEIQGQITDLFNVVATKDWGNTKACANIVIEDKDGNEKVLAKNVPTPYLLFLEKQLQDIRTFIKKLPTLSTSKKWDYDSARGMYCAEQEKTIKTQKIDEVVVLYPHTPEHPAQTQLSKKDVIVGEWTELHVSTAFKVDDVKAMEIRLTQVERAVKFAREQANSIEIERKDVGTKILDYVFG
jgi:hypothetical protein